MNQNDAYEFGREVGIDAVFWIRDIPRDMMQFEYVAFCARMVAEKDRWRFANHLRQFGILEDDAIPYWTKYLEGLAVGIEEETINLLEEEG